MFNLMVLVNEGVRSTITPKAILLPNNANKNMKTSFKSLATPLI